LSAALYHLLRGLLVPRLVLVTENLALRRQLLVLHRSSNRPRLGHRDRLFWMALSQLWRTWRSILVIVKPSPKTSPSNAQIRQRMHGMRSLHAYFYWAVL
jgi:hypothetical protein